MVKSAYTPYPFNAVNEALWVGTRLALRSGRRNVGMRGTGRAIQPCTCLTGSTIDKYQVKHSSIMPQMTMLPDMSTYEAYNNYTHHTS